MKNIFILFLTLIFISCNSDDNSNANSDTNSEVTNNTAINLVTGLNLREYPYSFPLKLGNPNVLHNQVDIYPNPPTNILNITSSNDISEVWILKAQADKIYQDTNFDDVLNHNLYSETELDSKAENKFTFENYNATIDISNLENGYYRIFVKSKNNIHWDNIVIINTEGEFEALLDYWDYN